jgi:hypothetical protein
MRRLVRATCASALAAAMIVAAAGLALADTQGSNCPSDNERIRLWENVEGDSSDGNDSLWRCGVGSAGLGTISRVLGGDCNRPWPPSGTWEDCVSSYTVWIPSGRRVCFYEHDDYTGFRDSTPGPVTAQRHDVGAGWNDRLSSYRFVSGGESNCTP